MYESPITLYTMEPTFSIKDNLATFEQKYKYVVNEDELYKALTYDREQYNKGYRDGYEAAREKVSSFLKKMIEEFENNV